jgi:hypothetical protein
MSRRRRVWLGPALGLAVSAALGGSGLGLHGCGATASAAGAATATGAATPSARKGPRVAASTKPARGYAEVLAEAEQHFAARLDEAELRAAIAAYGEAAKLAPARVEPWERLTRAKMLLADGFLLFRKDRDKAAKAEIVALFEQGRADAEQALRTRSAEFARLRRLEVPIDEAAAVLGKDAALSLYFWAQHTILWANEKGLRTTMAQHETVFRVMERVRSLDPATWYGGADRYFGIVFAAAPAVAGGDLKKSRAAFEASLGLAPAYLETWVLYAQLYARAAGDDALYTAALERVIAAEVDAIPELVPEQTIAKKKARALLDARAGAKSKPQSPR